MKVSELAGFCAGGFKLTGIWSEVIELTQARSRHEVIDELGDVLTMSSLWLHEQLGVDFELPRISSATKYVARTHRCGQILKDMGLFDEERAEEEPFYWRHYTADGSNMERPHKLNAFLARAKADYRGTQ